VTDERRLDRIEWRLDALDKWREAHVDPVLAQHERELDDVTRAQEIARAVADELAKERDGGKLATELPLWQKIGAAIAGAVVLADSLRGLVGH
jgi:hypothetical protein